MGANEIYVPENEERREDSGNAIKIRDQNVAESTHDTSISDLKTSQKSLPMKEDHRNHNDSYRASNENVSQCDRTDSCNVRSEQSNCRVEQNDGMIANRQDIQSQKSNSERMNLNVESHQAEEIDTENEDDCQEDQEENPNCSSENNDLASVLELDNLNLESNCEYSDEISEIKSQQKEAQICADSENCDVNSKINCCDGDQECIKEVQKQLEDQQTIDYNSQFDVLTYDHNQHIEDDCNEPDEPNEPLEVSTNILSYERFYPGRILGNTFTIKNVGFKSYSFRIAFENRSIDNSFVEGKLCDYYGCESLSEIEESYSKHLKTNVVNSKENLNVWNIEDPYTRRLTRIVEMELDPGDEYEFIVVLKSPAINRQTMFAANVTLYNYIKESKQKIFCFGCMESLKVSLPKEIYDIKLNSKMIKIVMRRNQSAMPIKVLLENKGDMQVFGNFQSIEMEKNLQFYIPKDKFSIEPNSKTLLEIKAVHKFGGQQIKKVTTTQKPEVIHKLVIAKIRDCEFKFSIIFEITII